MTLLHLYLNMVTQIERIFDKTWLNSRAGIVPGPNLPDCFSFHIGHD